MTTPEVHPPPPSITTYPDRDLRQRQIVPPARLAACHALVVGVGAIGRQVAIQLAATGVPAMTLVDFDTVDEVNLAPQAYWPADLGRPKVEATADLCRRLHPAIRVATCADRFRRSSAKSIDCLRGHDPVARVAAFCCVDSMEARKVVWEAAHERVAFWADGRMAAEVVRVLASRGPAVDRAYPATLFPGPQAYAGACTARSTVYAASIAAGLMLAQFTRWLRDLPLDGDVTLNLLSMEIAVT